MSTSTFGSLFSDMYTSFTINNTSSPDNKIIIHDLIIPPFIEFVNSCLESSAGIYEWVKKAYEESLKGCVVVCLLPARTDTKWFHTYIYNEVSFCPRENVDIHFIKGRIKFGDSKNSAPFPSMIVVFHNKRG